MQQFPGHARQSPAGESGGIRNILSALGARVVARKFVTLFFGHFDGHIGMVVIYWRTGAQNGCRMATVEMLKALIAE